MFRLLTLRRLPVRFAHIAPLAGVLLLAACEHRGPSTPELGPLATLVVTPNPQVLAAGGVQQFTATGYDADGNVLTLGSTTWSVVAGGGTINASGVFTAGAAAGVFANTVRALSGTVSGLATVSVTAGAVASIRVTPNPVSLATGATAQFTATGRDAGGNIVAVSPTWSVVNAAAGAIDGVGLFTAGTTPGTYAKTVVARSGTLADSATVTALVAAGALATIIIAPNPASLAVSGIQQFTASGRDANGLVVPIPGSVTWSVVNGGGTINGGSGLFVAGATPGTYSNTVRASNGTITAFATVTVVGAAGPLASIIIAPNPATMLVNATQQFTATGLDANGVVVPISPAVVWSVVNGGGTINGASGLFTAGAVAGSFPNTVRASSGSVSGFASVTVTVVGTGALATITVTPDPASLDVNTTQQFTATGRDVNGVIVPIIPAPNWSVVNGGGTINSGSGLFTAGATTGSFTNTVRATSGAISGFADVTVTGSSSVGPPLGAAAAFAVLGSTAVSCTGVSNIAGDVGVAPAGSVSGFPAPCTISSPGAPVPHVNDAAATTAQADVTPAYNALAAMACGTALTGQDLGGMTLAPGVYCFTSSAQLTGILTLAGPANGLWVFQVATALTTGTSSQVVMSGGGQVKNVFWQVGSSATIGQTTAFQGNIIAAVSVTLVQGASLHGRALSKAGVTMDTNLITLP
ncbi:MAG: ice-binding family protein [Gemmatimonadota bacterium]